MGKAGDNRCRFEAFLANQYRVVLLSAREDLNDATDRSFLPVNTFKFALPCQSSQVSGIAGKRRILWLRAGAVIHGLRLGRVHDHDAQA